MTASTSPDVADSVDWLPGAVRPPVRQDSGLHAVVVVAMLSPDEPQLLVRQTQPEGCLGLLDPKRLRIGS